MQLPATKISKKVANSTLVGAIVTVILAIANQTPLAENPWTKPLQDTTVANALVLIGAAIAGYSTTETAYDE